MDSTIVRFIQDNFITISIILYILKEVAKATPWATDDKIIEILTGLLSFKNSKSA